MKYYELIAKSNLVNQIPLVFEGRKLSVDAAADVVMLKVSYSETASKMQKSLEEVLKGIKKEGYDERRLAVEEMKKTEEALKKHLKWKEGDKDKEGNLIEQPPKPSDDSLKKAEETKKTLEEFKKEEEELIEVYTKAANKQLFEEVSFNKGLSKDTWKHIYSMLGVESYIEYTYPNGNKEKVSTETFLQYLGELILE